MHCGDLNEKEIQKGEDIRTRMADSFWCTVETNIALQSNYTSVRAPLVAQSVKRLSAMQETQVQSLAWEDPLEKKMATHSSILAWKFPWTEKPGGLQSMGSQELDTTK